MRNSKARNHKGKEEERRTVATIICSYSALICAWHGLIIFKIFLIKLHNELQIFLASAHKYIKFLQIRNTDILLVDALAEVRVEKGV